MMLLVSECDSETWETALCICVAWRSKLQEGLTRRHFTESWRNYIFWWNHFLKSFIWVPYLYLTVKGCFKMFYLNEWGFYSAMMFREQFGDFLPSGPLTFIERRSSGGGGGLAAGQGAVLASGRTARMTGLPSANSISPPRGRRLGR